MWQKCLQRKTLSPSSHWKNFIDRSSNGKKFWHWKWRDTTSRSHDFYANLRNNNQTVLLRIALKLELDSPTLLICYLLTTEITHPKYPSKLVSTGIAAQHHKATFFKVRNVRTLNKLSLPRQKIDIDVIMSKYPYVESKNLQTIENAKPEILIGQDGLEPYMVPLEIFLCPILKKYIMWPLLSRIC